jgi:hypothetical protein
MSDPLECTFFDRAAALRARDWMKAGALGGVPCGPFQLDPHLVDVTLEAIGAMAE